MINCLNLACVHSYSDHLPVCIYCDCAQFVFPPLNAPVAYSSGACAVDVMRDMVVRAETDPNCPDTILRLAPFVKTTLEAVAIPEIETVQ
jgi:hypothetical protein